MQPTVRAASDNEETQGYHELAEVAPVPATLGVLGEGVLGSLPLGAGMLAPMSPLGVAAIPEAAAAPAPVENGDGVLVAGTVAVAEAEAVGEEGTGAKVLAAPNPAIERVQQQREESSSSSGSILDPEGSLPFVRPIPPQYVWDGPQLLRIYGDIAGNDSDVDTPLAGDAAVSTDEE